jgi:hypothetical protein
VTDVSPWTPSSAKRFLDDVEATLADDLPLFSPARSGASGDEIRLERSDEATLAFLLRLVEAAASRRRTQPSQVRVGRSLVAMHVPGGPALLAIRGRGARPWRVLLALEGSVARAIRDHIPTGAGSDVGQAA